jgi:hypothetical protein
MVDFYTWAWIPVVGAPLIVFGVVAVLRQVQMRQWRRSLTAWELRIARDTSSDDIARWVSALRSVARARRWWSVIARWPIGMELSATREGVARMVLIPSRLLGDVQATLSATIPGARLTERPDYLAQATGARYQISAEVRITGAGEPLATGRGQDANRHLLAALQPLEAGETVRVQWLMVAARSPRALLRPGLSTQDVKAAGGLWASGDPVLWATCRVAVSSRFDKQRVRTLYGRTWSALRSLNTSRAGVVRRFLPTWWVSARMRAWAVPLRRWPILATSAELAGLLGLAPGPDTLLGVAGGTSRVLPPPPSMSKATNGGVVLAKANYPGSDAMISIARSDRLRHMWVIGPPGVGKSTLMAGMISSDIERGDGVIVVDAGDDLVTDVLARVPDHRADDVVVIDPAGTDYVIGLNPLRVGSPEQAAAGVYHVLQSIYESSWGPRTADILRASLLTLATTTAPDSQPFTVTEIADLLTNDAFRRIVTSQPLSAPLVGFWRWYASLSDGARLHIASPVLNKLRVFSLSTPLRLLLGQSRGLNFRDAIASKKIVLVPLRKGLVGTENATLVGSLVLASVWQAILSRSVIAQDKRRPTWLYVDEFQDTVRLPIDLADMLAQARRFGLGLVLAHQHSGQLTPTMRGAVESTSRTHVAFQLNHGDADKLAKSFHPLTAEDLQRLGLYEVAVRPCVGGVTLPPVTGRTLPLPEPTRDPAALGRASRQRYGMSAAQVEELIVARTTVDAERQQRPNRIVKGARS